LPPDESGEIDNSAADFECQVDQPSVCFLNGYSARDSQQLCE
jgi:hypothetical protein